MWSPAGMPPICLFSDLNHPPRRDFIKHLPYSPGDSQRLGGRVQAYSFWTNPDASKPPIQIETTIANFGDSEIKELLVQLSIDGQNKEQKLAIVPPKRTW